MIYAGNNVLIIFNAPCYRKHIGSRYRGTVLSSLFAITAALCRGNLSMVKFGLPHSTIHIIRSIFAAVPAVEKAVIYGSRAKGNYRPSSDIDLTLFGQGLDLDMLGKIATDLHESPIPYQVDLSLFEHIDNIALREHIERVGQIFYQRQPPQSLKVTDDFLRITPLITPNAKHYL